MVPPVVEEPDPVEVAEQLAPEPTSGPAPRRRLTARERFEIIGLIRNAKLALDENRLMSPANDNAYARYLKVLELDPNDDRARAGVREIARRYVALAEGALRNDSVERAQTFLERAKIASPDLPGIAEAESRIAR